ncbi:competence protein, partial [Oenococcus oeni]
ELSKKFFKN